MTETENLVPEISARVAERMAMTELPGAELRERRHLDPFMKDVFEEYTGKRPVSRTLHSQHFRGLGPVDIVAAEPRLLMELKWSYALPGKLFESVWDAVKLALLGSEHGYDDLYIATGASLTEWGASECADLFTSGELDPIEAWGRRLHPRRGPNYGSTVGEDLVIGARGNQPERGPEVLSVRVIGAFPVHSDFELRLVSLRPATGVRPWPRIAA